MEKLRVFEAFAGYGSQSMALDRLGINFEVVGISEIDKYAIQAYNATHEHTTNYGDITKIDWESVPDFDLFTYSFPCQDISNAGRRKGFEEGSGTRSSLLWECRRSIEAKKPKYLLMENVKALTGKKFMPYLNIWLDYLKDLGYENHMKVLNAKHYGIPQNRERVFVVSILGGDKYSFPKPFELCSKLVGALEKNVDESYYISDKTINRMIKNNCTTDFCIDINGEAKTICASCYKMTTFDNYIKESMGCAMRGRNPNNPSDRTPGAPTEQRIEIGGGIANCITTVQKDSLVIEPAILTSKRTEYGKAVRKDYESGRLKESRHNMTALAPRNDRVSNTITTVQKDNLLFTNCRIRKLTPRECFRLMGVSESDIDKIQAAGISNTQQYKMAGNSIVVDVLYYIFRELFKDSNYLIDITE